VTVPTVAQHSASPAHCTQCIRRPIPREIRRARSTRSSKYQALTLAPAAQSHRSNIAVHDSYLCSSCCPLANPRALHLFSRLSGVDCTDCFQGPSAVLRLHCNGSSVEAFWLSAQAACTRQVLVTCMNTSSSRADVPSTWYTGRLHVLLLTSMAIPSSHKRVGVAVRLNTSRSGLLKRSHCYL
jgi:hypothetical protein